MHIRTLNLNLIAIFDAIFAAGSIKDASRQLGMSQPAVSRALKRLRDHTGDELFVRDRVGMRPTPMALSIAANLRDGLDLIKRGIASAGEFSPATSDRTFVIDLPVGLDLLIGPAIAAAVQREAPLVRMRILSSRAAGLGSELRLGETELALDYAVADGDGLCSEQIAESSWAVLARRSHPTIDGAITAEDYLAAGHVGLTWTRAESDSPLARTLERAGLGRDVRVEAPSITALAEIAARTDLLATVGRREAVALARRLDMQVLTMPIDLAPVRYFSVWHQCFDTDAGHKWLRRIVRQSMRCQAEGPAEGQGLATSPARVAA